MGLFGSSKRRAKSPRAQLNKLNRQIEKERLKAQVKTKRNELMRLKSKG